MFAGTQCVSVGQLSCVQERGMKKSSWSIRWLASPTLDWAGSMKKVRMTWNKPWDYSDEIRFLIWLLLSSPGVCMCATDVPSHVHRSEGQCPVIWCLSEKWLVGLCWQGVWCEVLVSSFTNFTVVFLTPRLCMEAYWSVCMCVCVSELGLDTSGVAVVCAVAFRCVTDSWNGSTC